MLFLYYSYLVENMLTIGSRPGWPVVEDTGAPPMCLSFTSWTLLHVGSLDFSDSFFIRYSIVFSCLSMF